MSSRTPEQKAADEALTAAIEAYVRIYVPEIGNEFVLGDYVIITAYSQFAGNGDLITSNGVYSRDSEMPEYRMLGLIEHASVLVRAGIAGSRFIEEGDDDSSS